MTTKKQNPKAQPPEVLEITYDLHELPSTFHKAGLAGLAMLLTHSRKDLKGIAEIRRDRYQATLRIDREGVISLLDTIYSSVKVERRVDNKPGAKKKVLRGPEISETIGKDGKPIKHWWIEESVPTGCFLAHLDSKEESDWLRTWRSFIKYNLRAGSQRYLVFTTRESGKSNLEDGEAQWISLVKNSREDLSSSLFPGTQAKSSELVPFTDLARTHFLLHFWPYAIFLFKTRTVSVASKGKQEVKYSGPIAVVPDIHSLDFCDSYPLIVQSQELAPEGKPPLIDLPAEVGIHIHQALRNRHLNTMAETEIFYLVDSVEMLEFQGGGHGAEFYRNTRLAIRDFQQGNLPSFRIDPIFRRQLLLNTLEGRDWYDGFAPILDSMPAAFFRQNPFFFGMAARQHFKDQNPNRNHMSEESMNETETEPEIDTPDEGSTKKPIPPQLDLIVQSVVSSYVSYRLDERHHGLKYKRGGKNELYYKKRREEALRLTLEVRGIRRPDKFAIFFAETFCTRSHFALRQTENYSILAAALRNEPDHVRTLTHLALSSL